MMYDLVERAQKDDKEAMMELINRFDPLLKKYAWKLHYEDAYGDIVLYFIELIKSFHLDRLICQKDEFIISYINASIMHFYKKRVPYLIKMKKEISLSALTDEQVYYLEKQSVKKNEINIFMELGLENLLNRKECQVIYMIYVRDYSSAEAARILSRSRQAVNQIKQRALKKLEKFLED